MPASSPTSKRWPWLLLPGRLILFALFQAIFAAGYAAVGQSNAWDASAAWWPATVTLTNLVCLFLLARLYRAEGKRYWDIFRIERSTWKSDVLPLLATLLIAGPISMLPNSLLASALFEDPNAPMRLFLAPLPAVGVGVALLLFPITQGLVELPYYFRYIMPRLETNPWLAWVLASFFLGIQHLAVPLRWNAPFLLWRGLMFLPFAFLVGAVLKWRPRLLPYLAAVHVLIDAATSVFYVF